jgi:hypothetical protein
MTLVRNWVRSRPFLVFFAFAIAVATLVFTLWPKQTITKANFDKIQVGMSQTDLFQLLGPPEYVKVEFGLVEGPETYIITDVHPEGFWRGSRYFQRQGWRSSEIGITVICDLNGEVVCRYSCKGESWTWRFLRRWIFW